jgi:hypothetical protein
MRQALPMLALAAALAWVPLACAAPAAPEIQRPPGSSTPQPVGLVHSLRNIPEACVRLDGQFTGDPATPYRFETVRHDPCPQRAVYVDVAKLKQPPDVGSGWILNDRIGVARADAPACVATLEIWRKPGAAAPPELDAQGRARIYLDKPHQPVAAPLFTAVLTVDTRACH